MNGLILYLCFSSKIGMEVICAEMPKCRKVYVFEVALILHVHEKWPVYTLCKVGSQTIYIVEYLYSFESEHNMCTNWPAGRWS